MQIAKIENNEILAIGHHTALFPSTMFGPTGPNAEFLLEQGCVRVLDSRATGDNEKLVPSQPYIEDGVVYVVAVVPMAAGDFAALKATKNEEINASRLAANRSTFTYSGKRIACDELSRGDIDAVSNWVGMTGALPPGFPNAWKAVDNSFVPIPDLNAWKAFVGAMVLQGNQNFAHAQALKAALESASTRSAIEGIHWGMTL